MEVIQSACTEMLSADYALRNLREPIGDISMYDITSMKKRKNW